MNETFDEHSKRSLVCYRLDRAKAFIQAVKDLLADNK